MKSGSVLVGLVMLLGVSAPAQARQSISANMVECAALMDVLATHLRSPERRDEVQLEGLLWAEAAKVQAKKEGWLAGDLSAAYATKRTEWDARGPAFAVSQEFRDWTSYCRALAQRYDVKLP